MKYAFIAAHRLQFSIRAMCRCLRVQPSGFYVWLKDPLSRRAREDQRQIELIRAAWSESGKVYGYRKLHDDLADMGESCCPNRVARLTRLAGIRAQIGYTRDEARGDVFDYIEMFYNPTRKHARNGMLSPIEFERQHKAKAEGV